MPSEADIQTHSLLGEDTSSAKQGRSLPQDSDADLYAEAFEGKDAYFNDRPCTFTKPIQKENPTHRLAIYMKAGGKSNREIAKSLDRTPEWVNYTLRQPWARLRIQEIQAEAGKDNIQSLLASHAEDAVYTLIEVMNDKETAKPAERISASNSLLNRLYGNPTQPIAHSGRVDASKLTDDELMKMVEQAGTLSGPA